jgi:hypothetical protein
VTTSDDDKVGGIESLMSAVELRCESIDNSADNHSTPSSGKEIDGDVAHFRTLDSTSALDCLDIVFPSDEAIFEAMTAVDRPLEDLHRRSCFHSPCMKSNLGPPVRLAMFVRSLWLQHIICRRKYIDWFDNCTYKHP